MPILLLDTHVLLWLGQGGVLFSPAVREAIIGGEQPLHVSAVTAFEYADLFRRGRFAAGAGMEALAAAFDLRFEPLPPRLWERAAALPDIHRDPVDRMLIAHALAIDATIVTADRAMQSYPGLSTLW